MEHFKRYKRGNKNATVHDVFVPKSTNSHHSCLCKILKSKLLSCQHICRVLTSYPRRTVFDISTLHKYWHLNDHPLYKETKNLLMYDPTASHAYAINPLMSPQTHNGKAQALPISQSNAKEVDFVHNCQQVFYPDKQRV